MSLLVQRHKSVVLAAVLLSIGATIGIAVDRVAFAQQPGIKRTILTRTDDPASSKYEAVMAIAEIAPGAGSGRHRHPGVELAYVLEGSMIIEHNGQPPTTVKAGESVKNEAVVHNAKNVGTTPVKILAVYLVEKGKPMAEPVP